MTDKLRQGDRVMVALVFSAEFLRKRLLGFLGTTNGPAMRVFRSSIRWCTPRSVGLHQNRRVSQTRKTLKIALAIRDHNGRGHRYL
jgi:hypothetical protein